MVGSTRSKTRENRPNHFRWLAHVAIGIIGLVPVLGHAADSGFLFDPNGNLFVQAPEIGALPQITHQPQNSVVEAGETASFVVIATGTKPLSYQWRFNNTNINATTEALLLLNVGTNSEGQYSVVVTNPSGSVTSAPALLVIDSDGDGMGDSWELTFFGNLNQNALGDFDGDGYSNLREFLDGTDPTNSNSFALRLLVISDIGSAIKTPNQTTYTNGQTVTLTAIPPTNGAFYAWLGDVVTRSNPVTVVMTRDKTVYARFTPSVFTWTSLANGDWETAANWTPNLSPNSNDTAIITSTVTVTLNTPVDCTDFTLGSAASGPTLTGNGTLKVRGTFVWVSGTMSGSGRAVLEPGATLNLDNPSQVILSSRTLENGGTVVWTGAGNIATFSSVITNRPGALFHVQNAATFSGALRFDNAGTFRKSDNNGVTSFASGMTFNNYGAVEIQTGTLNLASGGTHSGSFAVPASTALILSGTHSAGGSSSITGAGQLTVSGGTATLAGLVNLSGSNTFSGGTANLTGNYLCTNNTLAISGTANFNGTGAVSPSVLSLSGTLGGSNVVTVGSLMNWTAGTMSGSGRTTISPGATLNVANPGVIALDTRVLENGGTVLWTGVGGIQMTTAVITNRAGALFDVQNALLFGSAFANRIDNAGTFRKSASAGTTTTAGGVSFNNSGTVEIQTGALNLGGGGTNSGSFTVAAGTTLNLSGGTHTAGASASITGGGQLTVSSGNATLAGLINLSGSNTFSGGTANLTGNYFCTNNTLTISGGTANFNGTGEVSPATVNLSGGTLGGTNVVTVGSLMNWTGGSMNDSGRTIIPPGATLNAAFSSFGSLTSRTLENGGTILWTGAGGIQMTTAVITNRAGALFHVQNAVALGAVSVNRLDNAGTFRKSANAGTSTVGPSFNNSGTVEIQTGTLNLSGGGTNSGSISVPAGTALNLSGTHSAGASSSITGAGQLIVSGGPATLAGLVNVSGSNTFSGGTANLTGNYRSTNNTLTIAGGTANFNGTGQVSPSVLNLSGGTLGGSNVVTVGSLMNWTTGGMNDSGRTIIAPGATLNAAFSGSAFLTSRTLENGGTILWTGAGAIQMITAVITNRVGALFHVQNAVALVSAGANRFNNAGTFRKSASTGTTTITSGVSFTNSGTVDIRSGILAANGGFVSSSNALLNCALGGTAPGTNHGQLQVAGTVTLNGGLSVDLLPGFAPATNDTFTVLTAGTRTGAFANFSYPSNRVTLSLSNSPTSVILRATDVFAVPQPVLLTPELVGTDARLTWTATSNVTYRLESNPNLGSTNWTAVGDAITLSNTASKLDPLTTSNRFYRIRVLP